MSQATLTTAQANAFYLRGHAFFEGLYGLTTRTAGYWWVTPGCHEVHAFGIAQTLKCPTPDHEGYYERITEGLRVQHSLGVRWDHYAARFVRCHCAHCQRWPEIAASVDLVD